MMLYTSKLQIVVPGLALAGILFVVAIQIAPHHWQGRCYQTIIESSSARRGPAQQLVCLKHIPFADAATPAQ